MIFLEPVTEREQFNKDLSLDACDVMELGMGKE